MVSLARANLFYEWRRYLPAVLAITFAGLLVVVQLALLLGMFKTVSVPIDKSTAHLWIGFYNTQSVDLGRPVAESSDAKAWAHPAVAYVESYVTSYGDLRRNDGVPISVIIHGIDTSDDASGFNLLLTPEQRVLLREPDTILIDPADYTKLGVTNNPTVEINGKRAHIRGAVTGLRTIGGVSVLASLSTARKFVPEVQSKTTFYLVRLKQGYSSSRVRDEIADTNSVPRYSVWEANTFSSHSQLYWLFESGSGIGSGFAALLALVVGVVITSQTLAAAITASIKEFAALRALGVPINALRRVVMEQVAWIALTGLGITAVLTAIICAIGKIAHIAMAFPLWMLGSSGVIILLIALLSGVLALRPLLRTEPASLLR